ncbi:MAG: hypothetical protein QXY74_08145 [Candidatus Bathyarchaeia archaeon]
MEDITAIDAQDTYDNAEIAKTISWQKIKSFKRLDGFEGINADA